MVWAVINKIICWIEGHIWDRTYKNDGYLGDEYILFGQNEIILTCLRCRKQLEGLGDDTKIY